MVNLRNAEIYSFNLLMPSYNVGTIDMFEHGKEWQILFQAAHKMTDTEKAIAQEISGARLLSFLVQESASDESVVILTWTSFCCEPSITISTALITVEKVHSQLAHNFSVS